MNLKPHHTPPQFRSLQEAISIAAFALLATLACSSPVQAQHCDAADYSAVSSEAARLTGMTIRPDGRFELDMDALVAKAGGPFNLLIRSRQQYYENQTWLNQMAHIISDPNTPLSPKVRAVYQWGWEINLIEMSVINSMECRLGLPPSGLKTPEPPDAATAERDIRIAQARTEQWEQDAAELRSLQTQANINAFIRGLSAAVNAIAGASSGR